MIREPRKHSYSRYLNFERMLSSRPPSPGHRHLHAYNSARHKISLASSHGDASIDERSNRLRNDSYVMPNEKPKELAPEIGLSAGGVELDEDFSGQEDNDEQDPWALDQLLHEDQVLAPPMPSWKKYARIILPHIGLILLSLLYIIGGAFVFYQVERPNEVAVRRESLHLIEDYKEKMLEELWEVVNNEATTKEGAEHLTNDHLDNDYSWTMTTATFFTTTLLTTIGYGNLVPVTVSGRMFCIFYALFGVPLILITVADIGKFLSENIIWLYSMYVQAKKRLRLRQKRLRGDSSPSLISMNEEKTKMRVQLQEVGFGDIVPIKQQFFFIDLFYIIVGLAITTMCIDLVGIEYIEKIHYFGRAISGARFALVNVGGKMVRVPDLVRCAYVLHQKYGQKKPQPKVSIKGAYAPKDLAYIRFIDYSALASFESLTSLISTIFGGSKKSTEPSVV
ncbi:ion channel domain-containing protein [Ditylenchus destructor]|nr:ion channel domain-containing protein [Ditylenchus destructor]